MMKRVFAVLLLGCLLCLALAGCGKTDLDKSQDYLDSHPLKEKSLYSVSFCLVSDELIAPEALSGMQDHFNRYTEANYNIHVEFTNVKASEYAAWLDEKFTAVEEAYEAAADRAAELEAQYQEYIKNGDNQAAAALIEEARGANGNLGSDIRDVYPEILPYQFDLIYIQDYNMLSSLVEARRLRDLYPELTSVDYRLIKKNMTERFFDAATLNDTIYAVPNCRVMANYSYLRVNAEKAKSLNQIESMLSTYSSTRYLRAGIQELGDDPADFVQRNLVGDYAYRETLAEKDANGNATWWVYSSADEQRPTINQTDLFKGAFAVTSYAVVDGKNPQTTDDDFCPAVKILYEIDTNPALHTILQYGIPGMTYTLKQVAEGGKTATVVSKINDTGFTYEIDPKYTGNLFSLYPTEEEFAAGAQDNARRQNEDTIVKKEIYGVTVTVKQPEGAGCTASANRPFTKLTETVSVSATPAKGYVFKQWTWSDGENTFESIEPVIDPFEYSTSITKIEASFEKAPAAE